MSGTTGRKRGDLRLRHRLDSEVRGHWWLAGDQHPTTPDRGRMVRPSRDRLPVTPTVPISTRPTVTVGPTTTRPPGTTTRRATGVGRRRRGPTHRSYGGPVTTVDWSASGVDRGPRRSVPLCVFSPRHPSVPFLVVPLSSLSVPVVPCLYFLLVSVIVLLKEGVSELVGTTPSRGT